MATKMEDFLDRHWKEGALNMNEKGQLIGKGYLLEEREKTHGSFKMNSEISQAFKFLLKNQPTWLKLEVEQKEALDLICTKLGRIMAGDANCADHWNDIAGYATLAAKACNEK